MGQAMKKLMSSTKIAPWALIGGMTLATFGAVQARADSTDELLELLRKKGAITKKEYAVIKTRHAAEKATGTGLYIRGEAGPPPRYVSALDKGIGIRIPIPGVGPGPTKGEAPVGSEIDVTVSGNLNAYYIQQKGEVHRGVGGRTTVGGKLADSAKSSSAVSGGLLPSAVVLDIATRQEGLDISGTVGMYFGINNINTAATGLNADSAGTAKSLGTPGVNIKLAYVKVGTNSFGTFEFGRDFGLFGQDILTYDQNELAVGVPNANLAPGQTTFGNFGTGYIVSDFLPQFRYTTPNYNGFDATFAILTPYDATSFGTVGATGGGGTQGSLAGVGGFRHNQPQFAGRIKYVGNLLPNAMLTAWAGGMTQDMQGLRATNATGAGVILPGGKNTARVYAAEVGGKVDVGPAELLGYGYYGKGVGGTALFFDGLDDRGDPRNSYGFLAQASYTFFDRLTVAGGVGVSYLEHTKFDATPGQLLGFGTINNYKLNESASGTVRYKVTKWLNLVGQYVHTRSKAISGAKVDADAAIGGAQIFF